MNLLGSGGSSAVVLSQDNPFLAASARGLEAEWGKPAVLMGTGGAIPLVQQLSEVLGAECVVIGFMLSTDAVHAPDENYDTERLRKGARSWVRILDGIQRMQPAPAEQCSSLDRRKSRRSEKGDEVMDGRHISAVESKGLYATPSGWNALLGSRVPMPPLVGSQQFDYAVVGAGYCGLAVARQLAIRDPLKRIALIESGVVADGSSGRNSGFMSASRGSSQQRAWDALAEFTKAAIDEVCRLVEELEIDCELTKSGAYRCSATENGRKELNNNIRYLNDQGTRYTVLDAKTLRERVGTSYYDFGLFIPDTYVLQPASLVRGLVANLPAQVTLFENSRVSQIRRTDKWLLITRMGEIKADTVILAANTNIRDLGYLSTYMMAVYTYAGLTPPLSEADLRNMGSDSIWGISPTFKYGTTMRRMANDRILVRSLYSYEKEVDRETARIGLEKSLHKHFPQLSHFHLEHVWGGILGMTLGGAPVVQEVDANLYAIGGCNGAGIAKFALLGKELASKVISDGESRRTFAAFGKARWMAPGPIRKVGFDIAEAVGKRMAGKDA
ncbi:MAG: FAD-dependent oxidoreductase [Hyphomicrobiales bacterium]